MSCKIPLSDLDSTQRVSIHKELTLELEENKFSKGSQTRQIYAYSLVGDNVFLPFSYAHRNLGLPRPTRSQFSRMNASFEGSLRPEQNIVRTEAIRILERTGSTILSMYCGFGKTICSINLACTIKFKTLIIVNKVVLMSQWKESINEFCPTAIVQKLIPQATIDHNADFYIINAINTVKRNPDDFKDIGTVIVDESHLIMAETLSQCMTKIHPRYLIGCTATPYRSDGLDKLIELYFGTGKVERKLFRAHTVYKVDSGFTPESSLSSTGRVNWGTVLDSQASDPERNNLIINIICKHSERTFLVLVKRVSQGHHLIEELEKRGESVTSLLGSKQIFDHSSRILIGTNSKVGTGFDHPGLDTLLLAADVEAYFIQYLGRCMRTKEVQPVVFDIVDNNPILKKHFATRRATYLEHGGTIVQYKL